MLNSTHNHTLDEELIENNEMSSFVVAIVLLTTTPMLLFLVCILRSFKIYTEKFLDCRDRFYYRADKVGFLGLYF